MAILPRFIRFRDAPTYLGMDRNRFNAEVRGDLTEIPIGTPEQRAVVDQAKKLADGGSLIPEGATYKDQLKAFRAECKRVGINGVHGLRHRYAQERYLQKTNWECPARGGPTAKQLSPEQRSIDQRARLEVSLELGHGRAQITAIYLGR